jgi:hypothetical protein
MQLFSPTFRSPSLNLMAARNNRALSVSRECVTNIACRLQHAVAAGAVTHLRSTHLSKHEAVSLRSEERGA